MAEKNLGEGKEDQSYIVGCLIGIGISGGRSIILKD